MAIYCISYTISNSLLDFTVTNRANQIATAIMSYGTWWHQSDTVWYIETNQNARQIVDNLRSYLGNTDKLLVIRVQNSWSAVGYTEDEYNWLRGKTF